MQQERFMLKVMRPGQLLMLLLLILMIWFGYLCIVHGLLQGQSLHDQIAVQSQENSQLERRNQRLESRVEALRSGDLAVVEERARKDLGMVKDKEAFFIFVD
mgnify:CR=1 FL=1